MPPLSKKDQALALAAIGLPVFPLIENTKLPAIDSWQKKATTDKAQIERWWTCEITQWEQDYNIGIATGRKFGEGFLTVLDVDNKEGKNGSETLRAFEMLHDGLPGTFSTRTPSGGFHYFFVTKRQFHNSAGKVGEGLDLRGWHGFVAAPGSTIEGVPYTLQADGAVAAAPEWVEQLVVDASVRNERSEVRVAVGVVLDAPDDVARAVEYLQKDAPHAVENAGGDHTTYQVCCATRGYGVSEAMCLELLVNTGWNEKCSPPWSLDELAVKVTNAYEYAQDPAGVYSAAADFDATEDDTQPGEAHDVDPANHPLGPINSSFAFTVLGSSHAILWERRTVDGQPEAMFMNEPSFHRLKASEVWMPANSNKLVPMTKSWMNWSGRRTYSGVCFEPGKTCPPDWYNLWRGFSVEPAQDLDLTQAQQACSLWIEHMKVNVCKGDAPLFRWLMAWMAHAIQKPWEKPLVAVVLRGRKGTGKNSAFLPMQEALGNHAMVAANRRYLIGNFNSHLESLLLLTLDEAFWSGDKAGEGVLKDLVTGDTLIIERKGVEPYKAKNRARVVILGNEEWLVPASEDERRYAVLDIGESRMQDISFFVALKSQLLDNDRAGLRAWLAMMQMWDLRGVEINQAPLTDGLRDQKEKSLGLVESWLLESLRAGTLLHITNTWPGEVETSDVFNAVQVFAQSRKSGKGWLPLESEIGRALKKIVGGWDRRRRRQAGGERSYYYSVPSLAECRRDWDAFMKVKTDWQDAEEDALSLLA